MPGIAMTPFRVRRFTCVWIVAAMAGLAVAHAQSAAKPWRIAVFGSSVANGTGDEFAKEGDTGRLRELLAPRGWEVLHQSRGGDNTIRMAPRFAPKNQPEPHVRYLLPVNPTYVLLGLSLGNEGIRNVATRAKKDAIFDQFAKGMRGFVDHSWQHGIVPVITLPYTRMDFTEVVDDGTGKWARGFWFDSLHPNAAGHVEITRTFAPTLISRWETCGSRFPRPIPCTHSHSVSPPELSKMGQSRPSAADGST
jgi:hypothetical protein